MNIFQKKVAEDKEHKEQWLKSSADFQNEVTKLIGLDPSTDESGFLKFTEVSGFTITNFYTTKEDEQVGFGYWMVTKDHKHHLYDITWDALLSEEQREEFLTELRKVAQENV